MLNLVSDLSIYWRLHRVHSSKQIIHWFLHLMVRYMLKTLFVSLLLNVLGFTTCIQHKADLVVLQVLLFFCSFSNFLLATFLPFTKWPRMRFCIFLFLLNDITGLLANKLQKSRLICRMCQIFLTACHMFRSTLSHVNTNTGGIMFFAFD